MTKASDILLVSAAALIANNGRVLVQRRPATGAMAGFWEFPGGKIESGETAEAALARELDEELGIIVDPAVLSPVTFSTGLIGTRPLLLLLFACRVWRGEPRALHATELAWTATDELSTLSMPAADEPLLPTLARFLAVAV